MKFDDHIFSDDYDLSGYDPLSKGLGRDYWQQANDDWDYYRRQNELWLIARSMPSIGEQLMIVPVDLPWDNYDDQPAQPTLVRAITGSVILALLGYFYWML